MTYFLGGIALGWFLWIALMLLAELVKSIRFRAYLLSDKHLKAEAHWREVRSKAMMSLYRDGSRFERPPVDGGGKVDGA